MEITAAYWPAAALARGNIITQRLAKIYQLNQISITCMGAATIEAALFIWRSKRMEQCV